MTDDNILIQLLRMTADLAELCKSLNPERDIAGSARIIALLEELASILLDAASKTRVN
jgi:hypothetical protein